MTSLPRGASARPVQDDASADAEPPTPDSRPVRCVECQAVLAWLTPSPVPAFVNVSIDLRHALRGDPETGVFCAACDRARAALSAYAAKGGAA
jgi:hypothetical protein